MRWILRPNLWYRRFEESSGGFEGSNWEMRGENKMNPNALHDFLDELTPDDFVEETIPVSKQTYHTFKPEILDTISKLIDENVPAFKELQEQKKYLTFGSIKMALDSRWFSPQIANMAKEKGTKHTMAELNRSEKGSP